MIVPRLSLLTSAWTLRTLPELLDGLLDDLKPDAYRIRRDAERYLKGRLKAQQARTSGKSLAESTLKMIEGGMDPDTGLDVEARTQLGVSLAQNAAVQFHAAGQALLDLAEAQAKLEAARGTPGEDEARQQRETAEETYTRAVVNIGRAAAGERVQ